MSNVVSLPPPDWTKKLQRYPGGAPHGNLANACLALREDPALQHLLAYDVFASKTMRVAPAPWDFDPQSFHQRAWEPHDDLSLTEHLQLADIPVKVLTVTQAVEMVAKERSFHPVLDYLDTLDWDRKPRLDQWLSTHLGVADTPYSQNVGRAMLIGAIARVRSPGCKMDTVPIFEGNQGIGKSKAVRALFDPWFSDELADLGSKDASLQMQGVWGVEISELDAMSRQEVARVKAFMSRSTDRFRPPYGHRVIESPRSCVFVGTTNHETYLKDETGARRFWPIKIGRVDLKGLREARAQLWAEADRLYAAGGIWWIANPDARRIAELEQSARYEGDPWDDIIRAHLKTVSDISVTEILRDVLHLEAARWSRADQIRVARVLQTQGFIRFQIRTGAERAWRYRRP